MGNGTTGMLEVVYKTNNDRNDSPYNFCMNMSHYERYLGNHYFYPAIATKSPDVISD